MSYLYSCSGAEKIAKLWMKNVWHFNADEFRRNTYARKRKNVCISRYVCVRVATLHFITVFWNVVSFVNSTISLKYIFLTTKSVKIVRKCSLFFIFSLKRYLLGVHMTIRTVWGKLLNMLLLQNSQSSTQYSVIITWPGPASNLHPDPSRLMWVYSNFDYLNGSPFMTNW